MKEKLLKIYLNIFSVVVFFGSFLGIYTLVEKFVHLPLVVWILLFVVHVASFVAMLHFRDYILTNEKKY